MSITIRRAHIVTMLVNLTGMDLVFSGSITGTPVMIPTTGHMVELVIEKESLEINAGTIRGSAPLAITGIKGLPVYEPGKDYRCFVVSPEVWPYVPQERHDVVCAMLQGRLSQGSENGIVCDGFAMRRGVSRFF